MCSSPRTEVYNPKTFFPHAALLGQAFAHCPIFPTAASRRSLDRVSVPVWPISLSARLPIVGMVGCYPAIYLMGREPLSLRIAPLTPLSCDSVVLCGISNRFRLLSPTKRQVVHALLTRSPLSTKPKFYTPFDLHVLGTPPAFVLSQDQTLEFNLCQLFPVACSLIFAWSSQIHCAYCRFYSLSSPKLTGLFVVLALYSFQGAPPSLLRQLC